MLLKNELCRPFLKWAGGKRWLIEQHSELFPKIFNTYYEPFLGSGAVFFYINPKDAIISDINMDLIDTYKNIRDNWEKVYSYLIIHHKNHSKEYYYQIRKTEPHDPWSKAAKFIYLNRTCFNGLYRVNLRGEFNVPIGTKTRVILPNDNFEKVARILKGITIKCATYSEIISDANKGDFIYIDPPYTIKHNNNNFVKYNEFLFKWEDQEKLAECLNAADSRGVKILISNADHECIKELYKDFKYLKAHSRYAYIAASSEKRTFTTELIISNYLDNS